MTSFLDHDKIECQGQIWKVKKLDLLDTFNYCIVRFKSSPFDIQFGGFGGWPKVTFHFYPSIIFSAFSNTEN